MFQHLGLQGRLCGQQALSIAQNASFRGRPRARCVWKKGGGEQRSRVLEWDGVGCGSRILVQDLRMRSPIVPEGRGHLDTPVRGHKLKVLADTVNDMFRNHRVSEHTPTTHQKVTLSQWQPCTCATIPRIFDQISFGPVSPIFSASTMDPIQFISSPIPLGGRGSTPFVAPTRSTRRAGRGARVTRAFVSTEGPPSKASCSRRLGAA